MKKRTKAILSLIAGLSIFDLILATVIADKKDNWSWNRFLFPGLLALPIVFVAIAVFGGMIFLIGWGMCNIWGDK